MRFRKEHFEKLMHIGCGEFKVAWKLTEHHIECQGIACQMVGIACQIFSETTVKAFHFIFWEKNEEVKMVEKTLLLFNRGTLHRFPTLLHSQCQYPSVEMENLENDNSSLYASSEIIKEFPPPRHQSNVKQQLAYTSQFQGSSNNATLSFD
ncbi:unnamed protein product [Lepeophtheirus salmonis]|uniref:(salmon louse) hypothetical protein n=1 Tax=Lepeophtheirus salmonis TaxID=72036 RepID=A0A7R8H4R2_LEPSM|nr:unnamed protein product [Lepeophtheirus salmonis]CAF2850362.1 unnamed protein product [Lepeophtheirus salmonis]